MEDGLAATGTDVHEHAVILETGVARDLGDEVEHPLRLVRRKLADLAECWDVALGQHEQMRVSAWMDVADRNEPVGLRNVVALPDETAEQAIFRQRESPPP